MKLNVGYEPADLKKLLQLLIDKNNIAEAGIRITLTGGYSEDGYSIVRPNLLLTQNVSHFNKKDLVTESVLSRSITKDNCRK